MTVSCSCSFSVFYPQKSIDLTNIETASALTDIIHKPLDTEQLSIDNQIFNVFKNISEDPKRNLLKWDLCGETSGVLLEAIFGKNNTTDKNQLNLQATVKDVDNLIRLITDTENKLQISNSVNFVAYSISFGTEHVFVIIQFRENDGNIKYRLLQSWMGEHTLKIYMENRADSLNQAEFNSFAEGLKSVLTGPIWTQKEVIFYEKYFMKELDWKVGNKKVSWSFRAKIASDITVIYGPSDLDKMKLHQLEFDAL